VSKLTARHYQTGAWVRLTIDGPSIAAVEPAEGPETPQPDDDWVAPAFWDIQTNGRWGVSFSDPALQPEQVAEIVRAQAMLGTARLCPTLITAPIESLRNGLAAIASACEQDRDVAERVVGIHLEGPYISGVDGYRGAHPLGAVRDPDWDEFQALQDASGGRVVLMTLAPERTGSFAFIRRAIASGVTIALGHTAADGPTLRAAADAGARLSTHLGNGIASPLPRHPNPIWEQAALDELSASFIADGHHLDRATLRVLVRAKTHGRVILVSDASPLAGLPAGRYGDWAVDPSGKIVVAGTPYLAGSNQGLEVGLSTLMAATGLDLADALATVTAHPARLLGRPAPTLDAGQPADLVRFGLLTPPEPGPSHFELRATCVRGSWTPADDDPEPRTVRPAEPSP
jgi:N-acetylglucosamine-6-phosphate deacetylase